jgi:hypothetical protein
MSVTWMLIFGFAIIACAYTSWINGFNNGVVETSHRILNDLQDEGIIHIDKNGEITPAIVKEKGE